jgi:hypothetical protein
MVPVTARPSGGVEVGQAAGCVMKRAALNRGNAFGNQLLTAVDQAAFSAPYSSHDEELRHSRPRPVDPDSQCMHKERHLFAHPQQCRAGIQAPEKAIPIR